LWLKRNPIGPAGILPMCTLLECSKTLNSLDLDNCGLLDEGVEILSRARGCVSLKHLYSDANGITSIGATHLAAFLSAHRDSLKSVYLSVNRFGDEGALAIVGALSGSASLKRLAMSSNRITDVASTAIVKCAMACEKLMILDIGCYKSTFDMEERVNVFCNPLPWIWLLSAKHAALKMLDLNMNNITEDDLNTLLSVARLNRGVNVYTAPVHGRRDHFVVEPIKDKTAKKLIKHPKCVLNIDSMYRNKM
jgi:Leucine-rich repeat (LRR) protein